jgi:hypothetical protein
MNATELKAEKERILNHYRKHFEKLGGKDDWRISLYADDEWEVAVLKKPFFSGRKQGIWIDAGTIVLYQNRGARYGTVMLHTSLMIPTSMGAKAATYFK